MRLNWMKTAGLVVALALVMPKAPASADESQETEEQAQPQKQVQPPPPPPPPPRYQPPPPPPPPPPRPAPPPPPPPPAPEEKCHGFFLEPEVTYMRFRDSRMDYSVSGSDVNSVETDYDIGWRLGLGYRWANQWDLTLRGSHLDSQASTDTGSPPTQTGLVAQGGTTATDAFADLDLKLETADLEVGRSWGHETGSRARVFFGPRWGRYRQDQFVQYEGGSFGLTDATSDQVENENEVDMWGVRVGIEGHVGLGAGWSFFGWGAISVLDGSFDTFNHETKAGVTVAAAEAADSFNRTITEADGGLGFDWMHHYSENWCFGVRFGYEIENWTDVIASTADGRSDRSDLGVDGGFVRFSFVW